MQYTKILQKIGLGERESVIYIDLLENRISTISDIAKRTGLHRPVIYQTLPILEESGLVSRSFKGKRIYYIAESPNKLRAIMDNLAKGFMSTINDLEELHHQKEKKPTIKILDGKKGIQFVFYDVLDTLKKWDTYYRYSARTDLEKTRSYLPSDYRELVALKEIQRCVITSETLAKTKRPRLEREIVTIPKHFDLFDDNVSKMIYGDKIAIIDYNTEMVLIVENPMLASFEEKIFKFLFKFLKEYHREMG